MRTKQTASRAFTGAFTLPGVRRFRLVFFAILLGCVVFPAVAQPNPFFSPSSSSERSGSAQTSPRSFDSLGPQERVFPAFSSWIGRLQRDVNERVTQYIQTMVDQEGRRSAVLPVLGVAFIYGLLHAFLPGHRKTVILSYYLSEDARLLHGVFAGVLFAIMHASSAVIIIVGVMVFTQGAVAGAAIRAGEQVQVFSSGIIMLLGAAFLAYKIRHLREHRRRAIEEQTEKSLGFDSQRIRSSSPRIPPERFFPLVVASGIVPCPGTTLLLLFTLSLGVVEVGAAAVLAMSAGLAFALSGFAVATILFKQRVIGLLENRLGYGIHVAVEFLGAGFIFAFGLLSLIAFL